MVCYLILDIWKRTSFLSLFLEPPLYFQKTDAQIYFSFNQGKIDIEVLMQKWLLIVVVQYFYISEHILVPH